MSKVLGSSYHLHTAGLGPDEVEAHWNQGDPDGGIVVLTIRVEDHGRVDNKVAVALTLDAAGARAIVDALAPFAAPAAVRAEAVEVSA